MLDSWMGRGQKGSDGPDKVGLGSSSPACDRAGAGRRRRARFCPYRHRQNPDRQRHRARRGGRDLDRCRGRRRLRSRPSRHAGAMGAQPAAAQYFQLSRYPPQRLRPDRRHQARRRARGFDRHHPDRGPADQIRHRRDRGPHRPRDLADAWPRGRCDARLLRAARHLLAGPGRRPLAGRWRAGQSGAGIGGARLRRRDRHRRQPLQRRIRAFDHDLLARPGARSHGNGNARGARPRPAPARSRAAVLAPSAP